MKANTHCHLPKLPVFTGVLLLAVAVSAFTPWPSDAEVIRSAISSNGVTFTRENGLRTRRIYVDPYILVAEPGNWIGLFSTTPEFLPQKIYIGTSPNGLSWQFESQPIITEPGGNALDPTAVPLGGGAYRVYYGATSGTDPFAGHFLKSGVLTPSSSLSPEEYDYDESLSANWSFIKDGVNLKIKGVSPEAILLNDGSVRLYVTDMGMKVYRAGNGINFTRQAASLPPGSDPTLIRLDDGSYRMYYVDREDGKQTIWTATSRNGLNWAREASTGIKNTTGGPAWGVPDSIELPDGRIRLYWVDR